MRHRVKIVLPAVALLALAAPERTRAQAKGPAFDCSKAQGEVQQLVCKDEGLAALDRKLDEVYKAARAKATSEVTPVLVAEQRGWVKGRDECWKAKIQPFHDEDALIEAVLTGKVTAGVAWSPAPEFLSAKAGDKLFVPLAHPLAKSREAFAVRKGDAAA